MGGKIAIALLVRPAEGGIKNHLLTLLSGLNKERFEPVVICPPGTPLFQELSDAGCRTLSANITDSLNPAKDLKAVLQLRSIVQEIRPDILHMHSAKAGLVGRSALIGMMRRPKTVVTMHSFVLDERVSPRKRALVRMIERRLSGLTDRTIAVSKSLKDNWVGEMGINSDRVAVIYNGIDFREYARTEHTGFRIGTVSRLAPQKGVDHFLRAAAVVAGKFPSAGFTVIGDGPFRPELESLAGELGIRERVEFAGFRDDAVEMLASLDVFVLASMHEAFGLTLVEAMSQRTPVVASRVGGIPEIVDGVTTGLLAEPGNPEDIAAQICRLLEDHDLAQRLASDGRDFVCSRFSSHRMVHETEQVYEGLLAGSSQM